MILKIKTLDKNGWILIDGITRIIFSSITTAQAKKDSNVDFCMIEEKMRDEDPAVFARCFLRDDRAYIVIFNTPAFILSDAGKTIERL